MSDQAPANNEKGADAPSPSNVGLGLRIRKFFGFCNHRWAVTESYNIMRDVSEIAGVLHVMRCNECGDIKQKRIMVA